MSWLLPSSQHLLKTDINTDLMRLDSDIRVLEFEPEAPYEDAMQITYIKDGEQGVLIGTLLSREAHADYDERHKWTMAIAEALDISENHIEDCMGDSDGFELGGDL